MCFSYLQISLRASLETMMKLKENCPSENDKNSALILFRNVAYFSWMFQYKENLKALYTSDVYKTNINIQRYFSQSWRV